MFLKKTPDEILGQAVHTGFKNDISMLWDLVDAQISKEIMFEPWGSSADIWKAVFKKRLPVLFSVTGAGNCNVDTAFWVGLDDVFDEFFSDDRHASASFDV